MPVREASSAHDAPVKDFAPVSLVASSPSVLEVNRSLPVNSVSELIAYAKLNPGKLFFGSAGNGSSHHLAGALFNSMAGVEMVHVPYRGTGAAMTDLLAGQIQVIFDTLPSAMSFVQSDQVKVLGVSGSTRDPSLPNVPTISELALPGYEVASWYGILAPSGTPTTPRCGKRSFRSTRWALAAQRASAATRTLQLRFNDIISPHVVIARHSGDYTSLYTASSDYLDQAGSDEKATTARSWRATQVPEPRRCPVRLSHQSLHRPPAETRSLSEREVQNLSWAASSMPRCSTLKSCFLLAQALSRSTFSVTSTSVHRRRSPPSSGRRSRTGMRDAAIPKEALTKPCHC